MRYLRLLLLNIIILSSHQIYALTYTTLNSGSWNDVVSVWSTDGVNPCGCTPGYLVDGETIIVNHDINADGNVQLTNGTSFTVNFGGSYTSSFVLSFINSNGVINDNVSVKKLEIDGGSTVDFNSSILTVTSRIEVYGTVNVDGGYMLMTGGNLEIYPGAVFNTTNSGKVDVQGGNISNSGEFNLCATCCFTTSGNWTNEAQGQILGSGAATTTTGNMKNFGFWSLTVAWCSAGNAVGMPGFENCLTANAICELVVLPVEFAYVEGRTSQDGNPEILWGTASEKNNDYFAVMRLNANGNWEEVGRLAGAGNSTEMINYYFVDRTAPDGTNYYRIKQIDYDGNGSNSNYVSIQTDRKGAVVSPNPVLRDNVVRLNNLHLGDQIRISDFSGNTIHSDISSGNSHLLNLNEMNVTNGMYQITIETDFSVESHKLVIL